MLSVPVNQLITSCSGHLLLLRQWKATLVIKASFFPGNSAVCVENEGQKTLCICNKVGLRQGET